MPQLPPVGEKMRRWATRERPQRHKKFVTLRLFDKDTVEMDASKDIGTEMAQKKGEISHT